MGLKRDPLIPLEVPADLVDAITAFAPAAVLTARPAVLSARPDDGLRP
ncbi:MULTISPECIES: hypothetical protein [unclassified Streptomyces]